MEEGRGTLSSQGSTQAPSSSMPPPTESGASSRHNSHVWTYFSRVATDDPNKFKAFCLLCIQNNRQQAPFIHYKGSGTGTLDRHLVKHHGITKQSHEGGAAHGDSQQTQIGGFMTSSPGGDVLGRFKDDTGNFKANLWEDVDMETGSHI